MASQLRASANLLPRFPRYSLAFVLLLVLLLNTAAPAFAGENASDRPKDIPPAHVEPVTNDETEPLANEDVPDYDGGKPDAQLLDHPSGALPPEDISTTEYSGKVQGQTLSSVSGDDSTLVADEGSLQRVDSEREALAKKLGEIESLRKRMATKHELLKRVQSLQKHVNSTISEEEKLRVEETRAEEDVRMAKLKRNATMDERDSIARERLKVEDLLKELKSEKGTFDAEFSKMSADREETDKEEKRLQQEQEKLAKDLDQVLAQFRENGFHTWLDHYLHGLPLVIRQTILKTSSALNPVVQGVEGVTEFNELLTNETTEAMTRYIPLLRDSPFYTGLIFYVILLCPTVAAMWLVMKVRARLSLLTVEHYLIAINLYFGAMSAVCAVMSMAGGSDVLSVLRHRSQKIAEPFMLIHGLLFVIHLILHGMTAYVSGSRKDFAQYVVMSCVGLHFFMHAYKRTILDEDPNIGSAAYTVYAIIFMYMLYDRGIHIIESIIHGRKAGLSAFGTFPSELDSKSEYASLPATRRQHLKNDTTVYFAGLPVFNAPSQSSLNDAKTI